MFLRAKEAGDKVTSTIVIRRTQTTAIGGSTAAPDVDTEQDSLNGLDEWDNDDGDTSQSIETLGSGAGAIHRRHHRPGR